MADSPYDDESDDNGGVAAQRAARRRELEQELGERRIDANGNSLVRNDGDPDGGEDLTARREAMKERLGRAKGAVADSKKLNDAENGDPIGGLYKAAGVDRDGGGEGGNKLTRRLKGISRRKKILTGAGVGSVTALIASTVLVTPIYRIPALMNDLETKIGKEVDDVVEARAERIIVNYLIARAGGRVGTDYVITGSPLSDLWRTYQSRKFEQKIYERTGIRFVKVNDVIHVVHDGRDLGGIRNYDEVMKIINRGTIKTKKDFLNINKSVTSILGHHKAVQEAKSFKNRFMKGRGYSVPKVEEDPAKTAAENAAKQVEELTAQQIDDATGEVLDLFDDAIDCVLASESCETFDEADSENPAPSPDSDEAKRNASNGSSEEVSKELHEGKDEAKTAAVKDRKGGFMNRMIEAILKKVIGAAAAKTVTAAIPYVGWIDLAATLQHAFGDALKNHLAERIPIMMRQSAYGAIFSAWEGYGHNTKAGKVPLPMLSALQSQLGDSNRAEAHKVLYEQNGEKGIPISPKVGDDKDYKLFDIMDEVYNNFGVRFVMRGPLELWYYTVGKLLKLVGDIGADAVSWLMKVTGFTAAMEATMKAVFGDNWKEEFGKFAVKAIMWLFGISIDPLAKGAEMLNNLFAGAATALNWYCHYNLGCRVLTPLQETLIGQKLDQKDRDAMAMTPLKDRLFSPDMPDSLTATLLRNAPTEAGPGSFMASLAKQVASLPSSIMLAFSPNARAAGYAEYSKAAGTRWYGALPSDLARDTAPEVRQQTGTDIKCPEVKPTVDFNTCVADTAVIKTMQCAADPTECPDWKGQKATPTE
jgi:hypothetical protein